MSKSSHIGIYENLPRRATIITAPSASAVGGTATAPNSRKTESQVNFNKFQPKQEKEKTFNFDR